MKLNLTLCRIVLFAFIAALAACGKGTPDTVDLPQVVTNDVVIDATSKIAWTGGLVTNATTLTAYGVCYSSTNSQPTINDSKLAGTPNLYSFTNKLSGLSLNTTYYLRAYATNTAGTAYGDVVQFKTAGDMSSSYGTVSTFAGSAQGYENNTGTAALFNRPTAVATDAAGNVYVADSYNSVIRKITPAGVTSTFAGSGTFGFANGPGTTAQFYVPSGLVIDASGNVFVADLGNNMIRKITPDGVVSTFAGSGNSGSANGTGTAASFSAPADITLTPNGDFFVTDNGSNLIRKITAAGEVSTVAGNASAVLTNGVGTAASFNKPVGIASDAAGNLYVADSGNGAIRKLTKDFVVTTFAGGTDTAALALGKPQGIKVDGDNNIYISDARGRILKISKDRIFTVVAGTTGTTGTTDGSGNSALFNMPQGLALVPGGGVYVADYGNNRIRKVN